MEKEPITNPQSSDVHRSETPTGGAPTTTPTTQTSVPKVELDYLVTYISSCCFLGQPASKLPTFT